jgi:hypothetical protein
LSLARRERMSIAPACADPAPRPQLLPCHPARCGDAVMMTSPSSSICALRASARSAACMRAIGGVGDAGRSPKTHQRPSDEALVSLSWCNRKSISWQLLHLFKLACAVNE